MFARARASSDVSVLKQSIQFSLKLDNNEKKPAESMAGDAKTRPIEPLFFEENSSPVKELSIAKLFADSYTPPPVSLVKGKDDRTRKKVIDKWNMERRKGDFVALKSCLWGPKREKKSEGCATIIYNETEEVGERERRRAGEGEGGNGNV
jgi:hypothetical protein